MDKLFVNGDNHKLEAGSCELVHQSERTRIFRSFDLGIKVPIDQGIIEEQAVRVLNVLKHEHKVSSTLPSSCSRRKVIRVGTYQDHPAMYFEWVEGVTADEWLRSWSTFQLQSEGTEAVDSSLNGRLQVAMSIVKAVSDFHEAGIFHGHLNLNNVVLEFHTERSCSATLIDYSCAAILSDCLYTIHDEQERLAFIEKTKQKDLNDLGVILYSVLCGHIPELQENDFTGKEDKDDNVQSSKRGKSQQLQPMNDLPLYLISLVSSLLTPVAKYGGDARLRYEHSRDVLSDLRLAVKKPEIYLKVHRWADLVTKPLILPQDHFYGRTTELSMLQHAFDVTMKCNGQPCLVVVTGYAGAGKTTLLKQITKPLNNLNGYMIVCKFDQTAPADTILASSFNSFFEHVLESSNVRVMEDMKLCIEEALGEHVTALEQSIPNLRVFLGSEDKLVCAAGDSQVLHRGWKFLLSNLIFAISREAHPIALVFEDLQWADEDALDTIEMIVRDRRTRYCLYCASYRDTDPGKCRKITDMIDAIHDQGAQLWSIKLGPIEKESVDCLVSESLFMPPTLIEPLSCAVRKKTGGMFLFVANFLKSLHEERSIYFNLTTLRWEFDLDNIMRQEISSDIVEYLSERMMRLPRSLQSGLKIAACLGSAFDLVVFQKAHKAPENVAQDFISLATENGFIQELSQDRFSWSHDQLQQAAYSLIPISQRERTHLLVGSRLYLSAKSGEIYSMIHEIVRNMNLGISLLETQDHKTELAHLNLVAGEKAQKSSAFHTASKYFMTGIGLLSDDWQNDSYDLAMKLFNAATEILIITGNTKQFQAIIHKPLAHAKNFEDRLPASHNNVRFLVSLGRFQEALDVCFSILSEFGEEFPTEATTDIIHAELVKTESLLADFPKDDLHHLVKLTDPTKCWLMKIMNSTMLVLFAAKEDYAALVGCRMTQRSAAYGWSCYSAFGLYSFGQALITVMNKVNSGSFWVKAGVELLRNLNGRYHIPVLETLCYEFISFWKEPIQATCEALIGTHQEALMEGQIEFAISSALHSCRQSFMSGDNLVKVCSDCTSVAIKMAQLKQVWGNFFHSNLHCLVLRLMGKPDVDEAFAVLNGAITNEDELLEFGISTGKRTLVQFSYLFKLFLAYWLSRYDEAALIADLYGMHHMRFLDIYHVFYDGLTSFQMARKKDGDEEKWIRRGEQAVSTFQTWEGHSNWNFENKFLLLSAELHLVQGHHDAAEEKYKSSITSARNHRFLHEEGLAMELLGLFYHQVGKIEDSKKMLKNARVCYERWGATAIVTRLDSYLIDLYASLPKG